MAKNRLSLILHAHLPFVRHIEYPRFLEEDWLYESLSETYLPMLRMLRRLRSECYCFRLTFSMSPTLCAMLADPALQERFIKYLELHKDLGEKEMERCSKEQLECMPLAKMYYDLTLKNLSDFCDLYHNNVLEGFRDLEDSGHIDLITTAATHAYLPLYCDYPTAIKAQVEVAVQSHIRHFKKSPKGFWLPECGYFPGLEEYLRKQEIDWFQVSAHSMLVASEPVRMGDYAPVRCPDGVAAFPRDYHLTSLVWSNTEGYPCDGNYREFYRDIGYDLPMEYIRPYIHEPEVRVFTGYKYWAITGPTNEKRLYRPELAAGKVQEHADNFLYRIRMKNSALDRSLRDGAPFYTLGFDAELFGHWWFEGIDWLEAVIRRASDADDLFLTTPSDYLATFPELQTVQPGYSSWGQGGYSSVWLDGSNAWIYRHIHKAIERMEELAVRFPEQQSLKQRFLNQASREVLLSMASDWPFILHNKTSVGYADKRLRDHLRNFNLVYENMCKNAVNTEWLVKAEKRDNIFPDMDYNIFNPSYNGGQE